MEHILHVRNGKEFFAFGIFQPNWAECVLNGKKPSIPVKKTSVKAQIYNIEISKFLHSVGDWTIFEVILCLAI